MFLDDVVPEPFLAARLAIVGPARLEHLEPGAQPTAEGGEQGREREVSCQEQRSEKRRAIDDEGAAAAEVGREDGRQALADGTAGAHGLILDANGVEGQREEDSEGQ